MIVQVCPSVTVLAAAAGRELAAAPDAEVILVLLPEKLPPLGDVGASEGDSGDEDWPELPIPLFRSNSS